MATITIPFDVGSVVFRAVGGKLYAAKVLDIKTEFFVTIDDEATGGQTTVKAEELMGKEEVQALVDMMTEKLALPETAEKTAIVSDVKERIQVETPAEEVQLP